MVTSLFSGGTFSDIYPKKWKGGTGLSNKGSLLLILIAGAVVYYFAIHRRR